LRRNSRNHSQASSSTLLPVCACWRPIPRMSREHATPRVGRFAIATEQRRRSHGCTLFSAKQIGRFYRERVFDGDPANLPLIRSPRSPHYHCLWWRSWSVSRLFPGEARRKGLGFGARSSRAGGVLWNAWSIAPGNTPINKPERIRQALKSLVNLLRTDRDKSATTSTLDKPSRAPVKCFHPKAKEERHPTKMLKVPILELASTHSGTVTGEMIRSNIFKWSIFRGKSRGILSKSLWERFWVALEPDLAESQVIRFQSALLRG
jgi:hypothetical protein